MLVAVRGGLQFKVRRMVLAMDGDGGVQGCLLGFLIGWSIKKNGRLVRLVDGCLLRQWNVWGLRNRVQSRVC